MAINDYKIVVSQFVHEKKMTISRSRIPGRGLIRKVRLVTNDDQIILIGDTAYMHPLVYKRFCEAMDAEKPGK